MTDPLAFILGKLSGVKAAGREKWSAFCPVHEANSDRVRRRRSLSVCRGRNGMPVFFCHACGKARTPEILATLGTSWKELYDLHHGRA